MSKRKVHFREEYMDQCKRGRNEHDVFCKVYGCYISIANAGKRALNYHVTSKKHTRAVNSTQLPNSCPVISGNQTEPNKVPAAEATFAFHAVKHHSYNCLMLGLCP